MLNASKHEARPKISSPNPLRRIRRAVEDYDFDRLEVEAQQCVKLTSTNRPFGLIIKLSQTVFEEAQKNALPPFLHSIVRHESNLYCQPNSVGRTCGRGFCCRTRDPLLGMSFRNLFASFEFP